MYSLSGKPEPLSRRTVSGWLRAAVKGFVREAQGLHKAGGLASDRMNGNGTGYWFDPQRHRSISVWCKRFSVNFATAPLTL